MLQASNFIQGMELNKGEKIACLEEIALNQGFISGKDLKLQILKYGRNNNYYNYVSEIIQEYQIKQGW